MTVPHILIIDNDHAFTEDLQAAFSELGCTAAVVEDGQLGLDEAQVRRPDLIVLAIELKGMNGFAVCNKLKKHTDLQHVPLVIVSSAAAQETFDQHAKLRTHAQDYLHKPIVAEDLIARCRRVVTLPEMMFSDAEVADDSIVLDDDFSLDVEEESTAVTKMPVNVPMAIGPAIKPPVRATPVPPARLSSAPVAGIALNPPATTALAAPVAPTMDGPRRTQSSAKNQALASDPGMLDDLDSLADAAFDSIILNDGDKPHADVTHTAAPASSAAIPTRTACVTVLIAAL